MERNNLCKPAVYVNDAVYINDLDLDGYIVRRFHILLS